MDPANDRTIEAPGRLQHCRSPQRVAETGAGDGRHKCVGKRHVQLSKAPHLLCGFSLNRGTGFDTVVRTPLTVSLSRDELRAVIQIPALLPRINFFVPGNFSHYSIMATLGIVPDLFNQGGRYETSPPAFSFSPAVTTTPWLPVSDGSGDLTLALRIEQSPRKFSTLMLFHWDPLRVGAEWGCY